MIRTTCQRCFSWMHFEKLEEMTAVRQCPDCGGELRWEFLPKPSAWFQLAKFILISAFGCCVYWLATH